ncbi:chlorogenate esterase [Asticcacaulis biprosthecium C19]|uniref:Chlorogenate esterase n=1 Tax=Asticcacaulis biprosthecium C19 TaxID=715226 RepID=F4QTA4_9CAUL|nr:tannase/feruloyl esterase family alpha/beta hydrolase [Asticcacaulis biprosthecium]EGF89974.1 chlorogenate esterase [Asticcacaulis biprosthecium C19]
MKTWVVSIFAITTLLAAPAALAKSPDLEARCGALAGETLSFNGDQARIVSATHKTEGAPFTISSFAGEVRMNLPAHCDVFGIMHERTGQFGQTYAIRFHMRLPIKWNNRMVFQGGGGSNGVVGDALGPLATSGPTAIERGFAVISQDSGHDNATNSDPARNGELAFGFDPQARNDYGHTSLKASADAAKALIKTFYGKGPRYSYFVGCSKGGQEGMTFAQYYPEMFDGIVASAPGFSLPRAAVAEAWDVDAFASLVADEAGHVNLQDLPKAFSNADFKLVHAAIVKACDEGDGIADGMVLNVLACRDEDVVSQLSAVQCAGAKTATCLAGAQISVLRRVMGGASNSNGRQLYAGWFWPSGVASDAWRMWKIGSEDGRIPALNVLLGGASLASVFTTPPTALGDPQSRLDYMLAFDFDRDAGRIYTASPPFQHSAWASIASRSTDLSAFRARGGRLIVPHGDSDPVFSLKDTLDWFDEVDDRNGGRAGDFVRVFAIPGMCHCGGGPATDQYDMFTALVAWVENGKAPDSVVATAGPGTPWPGRQRPLCAYPQTAHYRGGDVEKADSFSCQAG